MTIKHLVLCGGGPVGILQYGILKELSLQNVIKYDNIKTVYGIDIFYLNYDGTTSMPDKVQSIKLTECKTKRYLKMEDISKVIIEFMHEDCPHLRDYNDLNAKWRNRDYMIFKRIFCMFAKDAGNTTVAIGRFLGNDHSTIVHQLRQANIHVEAKDRYFIDKYLKSI